VNSVMEVSNPHPISRWKVESTFAFFPGRIFVVGNVKHPGPLQITMDPKAPSSRRSCSRRSGQLHLPYGLHLRLEAGGRRDQIPIEIKKIMTLRSPDVRCTPMTCFMLRIPRAKDHFKGLSTGHRDWLWRGRHCALFDPLIRSPHCALFDTLMI